MPRSKSSYILSLVTIFALIISAISFPSTTEAQLRPVVIASGFEFNVFANTANVPEFAISPYTGPTSMAFDSRGRLFVGTLSGKILVMSDDNEDGKLDNTLKIFASGLQQVLGLEFNPRNGDLYATSNGFNGGVGKILRLRDTNGDDVADEIVTILDGLPSEGDHQTDRIKFGPDGLLYIGQGSSTDNGTASLGRPEERPFNASILRIDVDNPVINVFATGLRNPFGMAFHPESGEFFTTDGGSGEICQLNPQNCPEDNAPPEEVNWVVQGGNYGFPQCEGTPTGDRPGCSGVRPAAIQYPRHLTPTSLAFYTGPQAGEFKNQLLLTLYKNLPNTENYGGDLRRLVVEGSSATGFTLRDAGFIAQFNPIDPFDGPIETAIHPISGDIYVARIDPVTHCGTCGQNHTIYRIHRTGSDALPFIGAISPASIKAGSGGATISITGRHLKPGAVVFNVTDNTPLTTRYDQLANRFEIAADLPASALAAERTITLEVRNLDGGTSNQQTLVVTKGDTGPPPAGDKTPQASSLFVYKKKRSKVINPVTTASNAKKYRLVVNGTDFDAGAQLLVNNVPLVLDSSSSTELVGRFTKQQLSSPGELNVQVRNSTGKISNTIKIIITAG